MKNLTNIGKSMLRPGEYVGYSDGVWRITRYRTGEYTWIARYQSKICTALYAKTLQAMSAKLANISGNCPSPNQVI